MEIVIPDIREQVAQVTHKLLSGIMKDWKAIQKPYLQDSLPIRLGGIAANLGRVKSFAGRDANREMVASLLEESKFFIEWTAGETNIDAAAELVQLQVQLSLWERA